MIAYVQERACSHWLEQVNAWIFDLAGRADSVWSESDRLHSQSADTATGICSHVSRHARSGGLAPCELQHLWVKMN
jgi:hypothetical protein